MYFNDIFILKGDRLWSFGLALTLVKIGDDLRLVAVSSMINSLTIFVFAAFVGRWIDKSCRKKGVIF